MNKEIYYILKKSKRKIDVLMYTQIIFSYMIVIATLYLTIDQYSGLSQLGSNAREIYKLTDNFMGEEERSFFSRQDNVAILKELYEWLNNNEHFQYIVASTQGFYMEEDTFLDQFKVGYEYNNVFVDNQYKSIQTNSDFMEYYSIDISEGRTFEPKDYMIQNNVVPILMGYDYKDYISIGDNLEFYYCNKEMIGRVAGFLESGSYYNDGRNLQVLDRYILMPALEDITVDSVLTKSEKSFQLKVYLDHCSGFVASDQSASEIQKMIAQKSLELNIVPYQLEGVFSFYLTIWGVAGKQLQSMFLLLAIMMIGLTCAFISISTASKIQHNKKNIAIYIANGLSINTVKQNIVLYIIYVNDVAIGIASIFWLILSGTSYFLILILLFAFNILIQSVFPLVMIDKLKIVNTMNGGA